MCKKIIHWTMNNSTVLQQIGFMVIRISFGVFFAVSGYLKLSAGTDKLMQVGSAISFFGITYGYLLWGYLAALTELCGGLAYIFGFCTRIASLPFIPLLILAVQFHVQKGDTFHMWAFPAMCLCAVVGFLIAGSGMYSADYVLHSKNQDTQSYH